MRVRPEREGDSGIDQFGARTDPITQVALGRRAETDRRVRRRVVGDVVRSQVCAVHRTESLTGRAHLDEQCRRCNTVTGGALLVLLNLFGDVGMKGRVVAFGPGGNDGHRFRIDSTDGMDRSADLLSVARHELIDALGPGLGRTITKPQLASRRFGVPIGR